MGYQYYDQVQRAHTELVSEGKIRHRYNQEEVEQDKGLLTRRAAYYVNRENDPSHGILEKTYGNQSMGFSVDIIVARDGTWWDIATDSGGMAIPANGGPSGPDPELASRWRMPTAELAQIEDSGPQPPGNGGGGGGTDNAEINEKLDTIIEQIAELAAQQNSDTASIIARDDFNTDRILDRLTQIVEDAETSGKKLLVLWMAARGEKPPDSGEGDGGSGEGEAPPSQLLLLLLKLLGTLNPQGPKDFTLKDTGLGKGKK